MTKKLLFAVAQSDNSEISATFLDDSGETQHARLSYGAEAAALQAHAQAAVGPIALRGVQIFTEHANADKGAAMVEALYAEVQPGGEASKVLEAADDFQAANVAMRAAIEAVL